jgi:hypothetical protein
LAPYRPREITAYACTRLRAVAEGRPAPRSPPAPPTPPDLSQYFGRYQCGQGQALVVSAQPQGLSVRLGDKALPFEPSGDENAFIASQPEATPYPLVFRRTGRNVTRAWHGGREYVRVETGRPMEPFSRPTPAALQALTGCYVSDDPWAGNFRVTAQGEALFVDDVTPLIPLPGGVFRIGEKAWSPERLRFDALIDGRPQRAIRSGVDYARHAA